MTKIAVEQRYGALSSYKYNVDTYNSTKLGLGPLMFQNNGSGNEDKWTGPLPVAIARPNEQSVVIPSVFPWVMQWSSNIDWIFLADNLAASTVRRINHYRYNRTTGVLSWVGYITEAAIVATARTIRGFRMRYAKYTTGTVAVSTTAVTGTDSLWSTSGICVGSRIGFGSTDPTQITTWYQISAVGSDISITLTASVGTIGAGTSYVIEELWAITAETNATLTNGGLFVTKGLRIEDFASVGTTIPITTTTDNIKAIYWLADAATVTNTVSFGLGDQGADSWTQHYFWVGDILATPRLFKYNIKVSLTGLTSGKSVSAYVFTTANSATITGTTSQTNNGRIAQLNHGSGNGIKCFYFTTTTRTYRSRDVTQITTGDTTWLSAGDTMVEIPPGSVSTFALTSAQNSVEPISFIDKLIILTTGATGSRSYITQYRTDSGQYDRIFLSDTKQINQSIADSTITPHPSIIATAFSGWAEGGLLYLAGIGTTSITNILYIIPLGADWEYANSTKCRILTPTISTPNCLKYCTIYVNEVEGLGGQTEKNLGLSTELFRVYYRTNGITDDTGSWTLLDDSGNLSGVSSSSIQFMFEFRTIGNICIPARILGLAILYEDNSTDSHWQPSVGNSDITNKRFAWRFATAYGTIVPTLRIRIYDATTGGLLIDDNTLTPTGMWQKSTDGGSSWDVYGTTDKSNEITYIYYQPQSIGDNLRCYALLTQN